MRVEEKKGTVHLKDTVESVAVFLEKVTKEHKVFSDQNIIIDLTHNTDVTLFDIESFIGLSTIHKAANKSFIVVAKDISFNDVSDEIQVVPTLLEAQDIIEIEEIERDLGF